MVPGASFAELWQPQIMLDAVLAQGAYLLLTGPLRRFVSGSRPVGWDQRAAFLAGMAVFYLAFGTPLDVISDRYLFSAHMVQHMLEIMVMVPLLMRGLPDWFHRPFFRLPVLGPVLRLWVHPVTALLVFGMAFSFWHFPGPYNLTLRSENVHFVEHAIFFLAGWALWFPIIRPLPEVETYHLTDGLRLLYLLIANEITMPIDFGLFLTGHPWYQAYAMAPRLFGISALADQQIGAVVMAAFSVGVFGSVAAATFRRYDAAVWYS